MIRAELVAEMMKKEKQLLAVYLVAGPNSI